MSEFEKFTAKVNHSAAYGFRAVNKNRTPWLSESPVIANVGDLPLDANNIIIYDSYEFTIIDTDGKVCEYNK